MNIANRMGGKISKWEIIAPLMIIAIPVLGYLYEALKRIPGEVPRLGTVINFSNVPEGATFSLTFQFAIFLIIIVPICLVPALVIRWIAKKPISMWIAYGSLPLFLALFMFSTTPFFLTYFAKRGLIFCICFWLSLLSLWILRRNHKQ